MYLGSQTLDGLLPAALELGGAGAVAQGVGGAGGRRGLGGLRQGQVRVPITTCCMEMETRSDLRFETSNDTGLDKHLMHSSFW